MARYAGGALDLHRAISRHALPLRDALWRHTDKHRERLDAAGSFDSPFERCWFHSRMKAILTGSAQVVLSETAHIMWDIL